MFVRNKSIIKAFLTLNLHFLPKYDSIIPCCPSTSKSSVLTVRLVYGAYFSTNSDETFSMEESVLWIEDSYFIARSNVLKLKTYLMDLFLTNNQRLASQGVNRWTGVLWVTVMFVAAVWTLILTAPIHCRGSTGEQVNFSKSVPIKKQTHLHLEGE